MLNNFYLSLNDYIDFIYLTLNRTKSEGDYFKFQQKQGEFLIKFIEFNKIEVQDLFILDLANGFGGGTYELSKKNKNVYGLDLNILRNQLGLNQLSGNALRTPFTNSSFDLIICSSLIEHLEDPEKLLSELHRIIKPTGYIYLSFPPFFSLNGGHDFAPFHLLGEKISIPISKFFVKFLNRKKFGKNLELSTNYELAYGNWGLYKMTICKVKNLIAETDFQITNQSTKWLPVNFSKIPLLGEFLTWHVQFLIVKN